MSHRRAGPAPGATLVALVAAAWLLTGCLADDPGVEATQVVVRSEGVEEPFTGEEPDAPASETTTMPANGSARAVEVTSTPPLGRSTAETLVAHVVGDDITAHAGPASRRILGTFANPNRHGTELVFQSLAEPGSDLVDSGWIPVLLPIRPNGTVGWIRTEEVELTRNPYRIEVDVDDFTLTVFRNDEIHFRTVVGIGEGATPTPYGSFYLTDLLRPSDPNGIYGPYAYGLSGFSESLTSFNGGAGVVGIHGTNQPAALGTRVSHGCIRVANTSIAEMATFLPLGTPVEIGDQPGHPAGVEPVTPSAG